MSTEVKHKTVDVEITQIDKQIFQGKVVPEDQPHQEDDKVLRLHFSLMGETAPTLSPLSPDYSFGGATTAYRYDWIAGITPIERCCKWNWWDAISENRAMVVQLLIDPGQSQCSFSEISTLVLALQPSKDTATWLDRYSEKLGDSLAKFSEAASPLSNTAAGIIKTSALLSNFISSDEKGQKNWFIYRFLDEKRKCVAVEWNISRNVVHGYGPLLRGSILLAFHGGGQPQKPLTLLLRPRIGLGKGGPALKFLPPWEELESDNPVALSINPIASQQKA